MIMPDFPNALWRWINSAGDVLPAAPLPLLPPPPAPPLSVLSFLPDWRCFQCLEVSVKVRTPHPVAARLRDNGKASPSPSPRNTAKCLRGRGRSSVCVCAHTRRVYENECMRLDLWRQWSGAGFGTRRRRAMGYSCKKGVWGHSDGHCSGILASLLSCLLCLSVRLHAWLPPLQCACKTARWIKPGNWVSRK